MNCDTLTHPWIDLAYLDEGELGRSGIRGTFRGVRDEAVVRQKPSVTRGFFVAGVGFEPTTFGL